MSGSEKFGKVKVRVKLWPPTEAAIEVNSDDCHEAANTLKECLSVLPREVVKPVLKPAQRLLHATLRKVQGTIN
ncbi:MAG: hypothetical protein F7B17_09350, partial [Desulfurococcales archaeon]|nr:hypothetical protein [Desulfurococcales archaeon]